MPNHSMEIGNYVFNDFTVNHDYGKATSLALLDLSAAFETIDHEGL